MPDRVLVLAPDATVTELYRDPDLSWRASLAALIGAHAVEQVPCHGQFTMWVDDIGLVAADPPPFNPIASAVATFYRNGQPTQINGTVVFTGPERGLSSAAVRFLTAFLARAAQTPALADAVNAGGSHAARPAPRRPQP